MRDRQKHVLITGAAGALGQELAKVFWDHDWTVTGLDRAELDITNRDEVFATIRLLHPDAVMNAAAYNAVDKAEADDAEFDKAMAVNGRAPGYLAEAAREVGASFTHFSTDYVFSGSKGSDYSEDEPTDPINRYGISKAAGEKAVAAAGGCWHVCRTARLFGRAGLSADAKPTFVSVMRRLGREKPEIRIVDEEPGMPTFTRDLAEAAFALLRDVKPNGIYHLINDGPAVTWFRFAEELFALESTTAVRLPVSADSMGARPAKRPTTARLVSTKIPMLRPRTQALAAYLAEPEISIVIVTHQAAEFIGQNLERLYALRTNVKFDVIIVDNDSTDGTPELIRARFPQVRLIRNAYNSGFAHACNQGAAVAYGEIILFFNPDMLMGEGALEKVRDTLRARPEIGAMSVKLVYPDGSTVRSVRRDPGLSDQLAVMLKIPHLLPRINNRYVGADYDLDRSAAVDSVRGSFFALRRNVLNEVGYFDERNFFIWFDEVDLCKRLRSAGYLVWHEASVSCVDIVAGTFRHKGIVQKQIWFTRSMVNYFRKWHPWWQYAILVAVRPLGILLAFAEQSVKAWRYRKAA